MSLLSRDAALRIRTLAVLHLMAAATIVHADTPPAFNATVTPTAPCGVGVPAPGHRSPELWPGEEGITLEVHQDADRLCYVANGIADAPVIRVRVGTELSITLKNGINDPARIDAVTGPGSSPCLPIRCRKLRATIALPRV